jgi:hypothetical protein
MAKQYKAQDFIDAIPSSGGIISTIARKLSCSWDTVNRAIKDYPTVKSAYDNECEKVLDMAESVLLKNIENGDSADAKWYLSRKGKRRGYVERSEVTGADGDAIPVAFVDYRQGLKSSDDSTDA